jgi:hypothetical protein
VVGRLPISAKRYTVPPKPTPTRRGAPRNKGDLLGSPKTVAQTSTGWSPHPSAAGAEIHAGDGRWPSVWPGRLGRVVGLRRDGKAAPKQLGQRKPPPASDAFYPTALTCGAPDLFNESGDRWAVAMAIRTANAFDGLGPEPCRQWPRSSGAHTFRVGMAAARTRWFSGPVEYGTTFKLCRPRPWSRQTVAPSQLDVVWAGREALYDAGIVPIPRLTPDLAEHAEKPEIVLPLTA